ncbi:MAG: hypothetical protein HYY10_02360 [Candidatus Liptonbacteria bacterium]|nr:hypothetical protein [Candidatus Liptonbacteria bacterium]
MEDTSSIRDEKIRWILDTVQAMVPAELLTKSSQRLTLHMLRQRLKSDLWPALTTMSEEELQRIGSYGIYENGELEWVEFWGMTTLMRAGLNVRGGLSARELLQEVALTVIVAIAWDIRHQEDYRKQREYDHETRRPRERYMLQ